MSLDNGRTFKPIFYIVVIYNGKVAHIKIQIVMKMMEGKKKVENLSLSAVREKSEHYEWYKKGEYRYPEKWDIPFELSEDEIESRTFMPMYNERYRVPHLHRKLPSSDEEIKDKLNNAGSVTLTYNNEDEEYYFALRGAGMDLSWDIARAYVEFGYTPPVAFCSLPKTGFAGYEYDYDRDVVDACKRSADFMENKMKHLKEHLDRLEKD